MKEILVIHYSQTGQLNDIVKNIVGPMDKDAVTITFHEIRPINPYPFPWGRIAFFDTFPESFLQIPCPLEPVSEEVLSKKYDLVIVGYQVWFLTPSIPVNSFLKSPEAKQLLSNTPVVTVIGARNMWVMAQEKMKKLLLDCNALLVGNIALVDRAPNNISVITIEYWLLGGKKDRKWGVFPTPGVSNKDIKNAARFANPIMDALASGNFDDLQKHLLTLKAVSVHPYLVATDKRGNVIFSKWAKMLIKRGGPNTPKRQKLLPYFNYYMIFAIWVIAPIVFIVFLLTYLPLYGKIKQEKKYYSSVAIK